MSEKRKLKRRHLIYYLSVYDRNTEELVGQLVDITTEGIMLTSEKPMEPGVDLALKMNLPEEINGNNHITFDAKSLWCKKDVNPNFFAIGLEFIDISRREIRIIENLIYEFSFQS